MESETNKEKEIICQKVNFSGYELGKLARLSKNMRKFLKELDCGVSIVQIKAVLSALADCYNEEYNCMFVKQESVAEEFDVSKRTVISVFNILVDSGLLAFEAMEKDKRRKVFCFTKKFFDVVLVDAEKIFPSKYVTRLHLNKENRCRQFTYFETPKQLSLGDKKPVFENITNNVFSLNNVKQQNFSKKVSETDNRLPYGHSNVHITGRNYPKYEPQADKRKESPLDLSRDEALRFILNLPRNMKNCYFSVELRKKWEFSAEELKPPD